MVITRGSRTSKTACFSYPHRDIRRKTTVFAHADETGNVSLTCRYFGISRDTFYRWKRNYRERGEAGVIDSKPCPENPTLRLASHIEKKILHVRHTLLLGQQRIAWYLHRYYGIKVSFHWHVEDLGIEHRYIKPRTPRLNGKVERSHRTDKEEFYQLLTYRDDQDLRAKLRRWENYYNLHRARSKHRPLHPHLLRVELAKQTAPPLRVLPHVPGVRIEHSAQTLSMPRHQRRKQQRQRLRLRRHYRKRARSTMPTVAAVSISRVSLCLGSTTSHSPDIDSDL